jgi:hypothetical protein
MNAMVQRAGHRGGRQLWQYEQLLVRVNLGSGSDIWSDHEESRPSSTYRHGRARNISSSLSMEPGGNV